MRDKAAFSRITIYPQGGLCSASRRIGNKFRGHLNFGTAVIAIAFLVLVNGSVLAGDFALQQIDIQARTFVVNLNQAAIALKDNSRHPAQAVLAAQQHVQAARAALDPFRPVAGLVTNQAGDPINAPGIRQLAAWWIFADRVTLAAQELLDAAALLTNSAPQENQPARLIAASPQIQSHLRAAHSHLQQAQAIRPLLDTKWLPAGLSAGADSWLTRWDEWTPLWQETAPMSIQLLDALPDALGQQQPVTYLVIIQSTDNLRATGGFLTGVGAITFDKGRITKVTVRDVVEEELSAIWTPEQGYLTPRILPPDPIRRYLGLGHWVLRDGNWWADFPATAGQIVKFWRLVEDTPIQGVVAITDRGLAEVLKTVGPIPISGGQTLDAENMRVVAAQRIYDNTASVSGNPQSAFFQEVATALVARFEKLPPNEQAQLFPAIYNAVQRRDIQVFSFDSALAQTLHTLKLDGAVQGQQDDFVYLVEDNLSDSKLNTFVTQQLRYDAYLGENGWPRLAQLSINKANTFTPGTRLVGLPYEKYYTGGRWDAQTQRWDRWEGYYGGYLRLFPPSGSELIEAGGFDDNIDLTTESNRTIFGGYVGVWPGSQRQLQFRWVPGGQPSLSGQYQLTVQHQPGTLDYPLTVVVHLPPGYLPTAINPAPTTVTEHAVIWETTLDKDRHFQLRLAQE